MLTPPTCFGFNQDDTCLIAGTPSGVRVYQLRPFSRAYQSDGPGPTGRAEMLFTTSLVATVGTGDSADFSPRRLRVTNTRNDSAICELSFVSAVIAVRMNRTTLAVVLDTKVHLYHLSDMTLAHSIDTPPNAAGVFDLSRGLPGSSPAGAAPGADPANPSGQARERSLLAVPGSTLTGEAVVYDTHSGSPVAHLEAHNAPIRAMALSEDSTLLATASTKGTVIRIFDLARRQVVRTLRRGIQPAEVYSVRFGLGGSALCASSNSGTVHVWILSGGGGGGGGGSAATAAVEAAAAGTGSAAAVAAGGRGRGEQSTMGAVLSMFPSGFSDVVDSERSFATARLDNTGLYNVASVVASDGRGGPKVQVATASGGFYVYDLDPVEGGECNLVSESSFADRADAGEEPPHGKVY